MVICINARGCIAWTCVMCSTGNGICVYIHAKGEDEKVGSRSGCVVYEDDLLMCVCICVGSESVGA